MIKEGYILFTKYVLERLGLKIPPKFPLRLDQLYDEFVREQHVNKPGMVYINWMVSRFYGIEDCREKTQKAEIVKARHVAMYLMHCNNHTIKNIMGFYKQNNATIIHAIKYIEKVYNSPWKGRELTQNIRTLKYMLL